MKNAKSKNRQMTERLEAIAKEHLGIETLTERSSDSLDFHDVSVWRMTAALAAAYQAGRASATKNEPAALDEAVRENLSPHAVALIAAKLGATVAKGDEGRQAEAASAWFAKRLVELLGNSEYESLLRDMEI